MYSTRSAKSVIDIGSVHGISFQDPQKLTVQTHNLGDFHSHLPTTIIDGGHKVNSIDNPDDDLASILGYLTGGGGMLRGLDKRISQKTKLPVYVAEDPLRAVARGTGIALKNTSGFSFLIQ